MLARATLIDILFLFWVRYLVVLFIITQFLVLAATAPKREHQQQQQHRVSAFYPHIVSLR